MPGMSRKNSAKTYGEKRISLFARLLFTGERHSFEERTAEMCFALEGRQILRRFMVRGHWRRPAPTWKEQRMRWIQPYWKGPDMATIIERTYKLKP